MKEESEVFNKQHNRVMVGGIRFFLGIETRIEEDEEKEKEVKVEEVDQHAYVIRMIVDDSQ